MMDEVIRKEVVAQLRSALSAVHELIGDSDVTEQIAESDALAGTISETNALGFVVDDVEVMSVCCRGAQVLVSVCWAATGDQDEDKMFCGDEIVGTADVILDDETTGVTVENIVAEKKDYRED
jgi:hypothetical protein